MQLTATFILKHIQAKKRNKQTKQNQIIEKKNKKKKNTIRPIVATKQINFQKHIHKNKTNTKKEEKNI